MTPTKSFLVFAQYVASDELNRVYPSLPHDIEKRLWAAAQFDVLATQGGLPRLDYENNGCGFVLVDDSLYWYAIDEAMKPILSWHGIASRPAHVVPWHHRLVNHSFL